MLKRMFTRMPAMAVAAALAAVVAGCGITTEYTVPSGVITTLMPGWERFFSVKWTAEPERGGTRDIDGYISNTYGEYASQVRLLVQARDASNAVVDQKIVWVPFGVGGFGRTYFDAGKLPAADHYEVSVWDYTFNQAP
jgi:hypothetical protein